MEDYRSLMQRLQDLEDALELDRQPIFGNTLKYGQK